MPSPCIRGASRNGYFAFRLRRIFPCREGEILNGKTASGPDRFEVFIFKAGMHPDGLFARIARA